MKNFWLCCCLLLGFSQSVLANVVIYGTRFVYPANKKEVTIQLKNVGKHPSLVQAWIEAEHPQNQQVAPFIITPPVSRIEPNTAQILRLMYTGEPLPQDRESVYYLNILDIPPKPTKANADMNYLQFSIQSRLKVFYRPKALQGKAGTVAQEVLWHVKTAQDGSVYLLAENPTPFHVTFNRIAIKDGGNFYEADHAKMLAPKSTEQYKVKHLQHAPKAGSQINYSFVNDYGVNIDGVAILSE